MGISMSVTTATDAQLVSFESEPVAHQAHVRMLEWTADCCYLADYWDGIHYLIAGGTSEGHLPLAALKKGDITYTPSSLEPVHGIRADTARAFDAQLQLLTDETLRARFDSPAMLAANVYPGRLWLGLTAEDSSFRELQFYLDRLRAIARRAANGNLGLIFSRYEDW
jgi:hypothetical protein